MAKTTVELNLSAVFGAILLIAGLLILAIVSVMAFQLAMGTLPPLQVQPGETTGGYQISRETAFLLGILLQIGMFAVLVGVAYTLMRSGIALVLRREKD